MRPLLCKLYALPLAPGTSCQTAAFSYKKSGGGTSATKIVARTDKLLTVSGDGNSNKIGSVNGLYGRFAESGRAAVWKARADRTASLKNGRVFEKLAGFSIAGSEYKIFLSSIKIFGTRKRQAFHF
jgi:hypothetical protein